MQIAEEQTAELDAARRQLEELTAEVARNDEKLRRSQQRELQLLQSPNLDSLFHEMTDGLRDSYRLECVSVVLSDPGHDVRHLLVTFADGSGIPNLHLVESLIGIAPQYVGLRRPWLGAYAACDHQLIFGKARGVASVAMIPLRFQGDLIGSSNLVCLMLDIDHFKRVNDTWDHAAGDAVLRELAQRIESQVRASDVAARYGGEEFVILLPNTAGAAGLQLAQRVRGAVCATPFELPGGGSVDVTVSIGIASLVPDAKNKDLKSLGDALIARADVALYSAKAAGRDRVVHEAAA